MSATKKYSDKWYQLRDAIMSAEEAVSELNNTISENEKKIEELEQQVLKLHTDLESAVRDEIDARIQAERDMLDGTVSMQNIILDAIRERYRKEWELMQEDISKKRKALEEEMSLIDERLQRRKDAEDEAAKHEELTELKRQLALVSMDSTRTKDQAKLREKIREIEDELAWDAAEDEADIQKDALQEQIDAYDSYEEEYQKYLDELLEDANNFSSEVSSVLSMSQEDLLKWLSDNIEEFRLSLKDNQEQLTKNWTETFKQMKGIVDTFWEEIAGTLSSKESFLDYMKQSTTYQHASDDEKAQLEYNWSEMYDNWISAKKESDEAKKYEHDDDNFAGNKNTTTNSTVTYYGGYNSQGVWVTGYGATKADAQALVRSKGLTSVQYDTRRRPPEPPRVDIPSDMDSVMNPTLSDNKNTNNSRENYSAGSSASLPAKSQSSVVTPVILDDLLTDQHIVKRYARGGIVDYTGYAWVDGTKQNPEAF